MAEIIFINPRTEISFWGHNYSLPFFNKGATTPVTALALLAALTPEKHNIRIFDEELESIDYREVAQADIIGLTGMIVQRERMREIANKVKQLGKFLVVGGAWITAQEDYLENLADVIFVGEADYTWPLFIKQWEEGNYLTRYEQKEYTIMSSLPLPRYDLLKLDRYFVGSVQISRGCPFLCEFCDIIVTFGRKPRYKTIEQVIQEMEIWRRSNVLEVFIVDDNLIANRKESIPILTQLAKWQRKHKFPFRFFVQASLNLADDEELLNLFVEANIQIIFVGIETPNEASLIETRKLPNINRRDQKALSSVDVSDSFLLRQIRKIQKKGIEVSCGLILGFDADDSSIFEAQRSFLAKSCIPLAMIGLLSAIPKTPLYERLKTAQRLDEKEAAIFGTNVIPLNMSREQLRDGFIDLVRHVYEPKNYFDRLDDFYIDHRFYQTSVTARNRHMSFLVKIKRTLRSLALSMIVFPRFLLKIDNRKLRSYYIRRFFSFIISRPAPDHVIIYVAETIFHYHFYRYSQDMALKRTGIVSTM